MTNAEYMLYSLLTPVKFNHCLMLQIKKYCGATIWQRLRAHSLVGDVGVSDVPRSRHHGMFARFTASVLTCFFSVWCWL